MKKINSKTCKLNGDELKALNKNKLDIAVHKNACPLLTYNLMTEMQKHKYIVFSLNSKRYLICKLDDNYHILDEKLTKVSRVIGFTAFFCFTRFIEECRQREVNADFKSFYFTNDVATATSLLTTG